MNQWNLLHANQPEVPEATPAPGFERFLNQKTDQQVPTSTAPGKATKKCRDFIYTCEIFHFSRHPKFLNEIICRKRKNSMRSCMLCFLSGVDCRTQSFMGHLTNEEDEIDIFNGGPEFADYSSVFSLNLENGKRRAFSCCVFPFDESLLGTPPL